MEHFKKNTPQSALEKQLDNNGSIETTNFNSDQSEHTENVVDEIIKKQLLENGIEDKDDLITQKIMAQKIEEPNHSPEFRNVNQKLPYNLKQHIEELKRTLKTEDISNIRRNNIEEEIVAQEALLKRVLEKLPEHLREDFNFGEI
jgi:GTPase Era involved in 16S rRNA processing